MQRKTKLVGAYEKKTAKVGNQRKMTVHSKIVMTPVFRSKKQEELFAKCARRSSSSEAKLIW